MTLKIRLARFGRTCRPFYWIVLARSQSPRDGKFIKKMGTYDPLAKSDVKISITDLPSLKKYVSCGAQPTDVVIRLLKKASISLND
jgi:small subunit ribosomal protein S16